MDSFFQSLARLGSLRLAAIVGITIGVTIALVLMSAGIGKADKALLYSELSLVEAGAITTKLEQMGVKYELRSGGTAIFVERKKLQTSKMALAAENLPSSGSIGYDIFDETGSMGQTVFIQNISKLRALQGELERTITSMDGVDAARVLLVMPDRKLFQTEVNKAKASVTIKLSNNAIGYRQTNAIRHLVSAAVPDLAISGVTVIDDSGRVLAGNNDEEGQGTSESSGRRASIEDALRLKVERVLSSIVGVGGVDVQVNVELDQSRVTERSTIYDPDGQVVISSDTSIQSSDEQDKDQAGSVTVGANVPGNDGATENGAGSSASNSTESETINYGVSKTETTKIHHVGIIKRLSIAVNVDGITGTDEQGNPTWQPRPADEMQSIENLIKSAIGFDASRNDNLQVTNIRFVRPAPLLVDVEAAKPGFTKDDIMRLIEIGILALVSVVMILFLGRPLITALLSGGGAMGGTAMGGAGSSLAIAGGAAGEMPQLTGGQAGSTGQMALPAPDGTAQVAEQGLDISKIDGQVKASSIKKVAGIVESHPEESVSILRNWLHES